MAQARFVEVRKAGGAFEAVQRQVPEPQAGQVRIRIEACGICHSDMFAKEGVWPGIVYPRVPGHEVAGRIDDVGRGVEAWKVGDRVGVGWHGGHCYTCRACRAGDFVSCENGQISGLTMDGGYAEFMVAPQGALARIPEGLGAVEAAPLLCAGITTFNALRNSGARSGDLVAVQGIGGLGHLAIQFCSKMGFRTVAVSNGREKAELARKLGATDYLDASGTDAAGQLRKMGGAHVILATAPNSKIIAPMVGGLAGRGKLLIVGAAAEPMQIVPMHLLSGRSISGWPSGNPRDSEDTMNFSVLTGVRAMVETFPLENASSAYDRMMANKVRFRAVLTTGS